MCIEHMVHVPSDVSIVPRDRMKSYQTIGNLWELENPLNTFSIIESVHEAFGWLILFHETPWLVASTLRLLGHHRDLPMLSFV